MDAILQFDQNILLLFKNISVTTGWTGSERDHASWRFWNLTDSSYNRSADS